MALTGGHIASIEADGDYPEDFQTKQNVLDLYRLVLPDIFGQETVPAEGCLHPLLSYRHGLSPMQRRIGCLVLGGLGVVALLQPGLIFLFATCMLWSVFAALIVWRLILVLIGFGLRLLEGLPRRIVQPNGDELPIYSVLVAVYHETEMMPQLAAALNQLVWPADRLDIQILFEADDGETLLAAEACRFPEGTRLVIVPPGEVKTKANALNYGLTRALGTYVCIYDAEDRPHPGQLLEACRVFESSGPDLACLQAPLVADNQDEALIASHWSLEYATQFGLLLPAMETLNLPIPIGGTSNHFRGLMQQTPKHRRARVSPFPIGGGGNDKVTMLRALVCLCGFDFPTRAGELLDSKQQNR